MASPWRVYAWADAARNAGTRQQPPSPVFTITRAICPALFRPALPVWCPLSQIFLGDSVSMATSCLLSIRITRWRLSLLVFLSDWTLYGLWRHDYLPQLSLCCLPYYLCVCTFIREFLWFFNFFFFLARRLLAVFINSVHKYVTTMKNVCLCDSLRTDKMATMCTRTDTIQLYSSTILMSIFVSLSAHRVIKISFYYYCILVIEIWKQ